MTAPTPLRLLVLAVLVQQQTTQQLPTPRLLAAAVVATPRFST
jgi:hypothetical protein